MVEKETEADFEFMQTLSNFAVTSIFDGTNFEKAESSVLAMSSTTSSGSKTGLEETTSSHIFATESLA